MAAQAATWWDETDETLPASRQQYVARCWRCRAVLAEADDVQRRDWLAVLHPGFVKNPDKPGVYELAKRARDEWRYWSARGAHWDTWAPRARRGRMAGVRIGIGFGGHGMKPLTWVHCVCSAPNLLLPMRDDAR